MISAAFSVVKQSMMLNCFPRMRVIYTNVKVGRLLGVLLLSFALRLVLGTHGQAFTHHDVPILSQRATCAPRPSCRDPLRVAPGSDVEKLPPNNLYWLQRSGIFYRRPPAAALLLLMCCCTFSKLTAAGCMLNLQPNQLQTCYLLLQVRGQLWVPFVMIFMGALCIAAVGIFQNSVALGFSYGVCVSTLMMGTDLLVALAMVVVWELPLVLPIMYLIFFGFVDGVFFTANLTKIPLGDFFHFLWRFKPLTCAALCHAFSIHSNLCKKSSCSQAWV